jgi:peroxiredoxin
MDAALLIARLVLAVVFILAGLAKLWDLKGSRKAITDFGLPAVLASPLAILLPLAELGVGAALIPASSAWWGALGALGLLLLFVVGISINLARGRKPDCHCFGQLHSAPAGWKTLARNGVLAAIAGFVLWAGYEGGGAGPSALSWLGALSTAQLLSLLGGVLVLSLLAGQWWFLVHLLRQNGRLLVRLEAVEASLATDGSVVGPSQNGGALNQAEGLPVGSEAPQFSLSGLYGETFTLDALRSSGKPLMMLFTDPNCGPCNAMLPEVGRWQEEHAQKLTLALVSRGDPDENRTKASEHALKNVLLQKDWEVSESYEVRGTPSAVLISPDGRIASLVAGRRHKWPPLVCGRRTRPASDATPPTPNPRAAVPQLRQGPRRRSHRSGGPEGRRGGSRGEASRPGSQHRGAYEELQGPADPASLLEPWVRLLPADGR